MQGTEIQSHFNVFIYVAPGRPGSVEYDVHRAESLTAPPMLRSRFAAKTKYETIGSLRRFGSGVPRADVRNLKMTVDVGWGGLDHPQFSDACICASET